MAGTQPQRRCCTRPRSARAAARSAPADGAGARARSAPRSASACAEVRPRRDAREHAQVMTRKAVVVSPRRHLGHARDDEFGPQLAGHTETAHPQAEECAQEVADPATPAEEMVDAAPPGAGGQAGMTGHPGSRTGVPIEVKRIGERESGEVAQRLAAKLRLLPV